MTSFACGDESSCYAQALSYCVPFLRPAGAYLSSASSPRLTPWAAFLRRFAALQAMEVLPGHGNFGTVLKVRCLQDSTEISAHTPLLMISAYTSGWILSCNPSRIGHGPCPRVRG